MSKNKHMKIGTQDFLLGNRTYIMGVLNVTPDSFFDGGIYFNFDKAIAHAHVMIDQGADIIDIGGESTRPGHVLVSDQIELERVLPVIKAIRKFSDIPISIDTTKPDVADQALTHGADMLNDVSCLKNPELAVIAARHNKTICLQHNRDEQAYQNFLPDVIQDLINAIDLALNAGIRREQIILDPGIGFAKNLDQNLEVLRKLDVFCKLGYPVLVGTSRKSFIGKILDESVDARLEGTIAANVLAIINGCDFVRVHDILENRRACKIIDALVRIK